MIHHHNDSMTFIQHLDDFYRTYANCCDKMHTDLHHDQFDIALDTLHGLKEEAELLGMEKLFYLRNLLLSYLDYLAINKN